MSAYGLVAVDTCCCVYYLDGTSTHFGLMRELFVLAAQRTLQLELAGITMLELLVKPFQTGDRRHLEIVMKLAKRQLGVRTMPVTERVLVTAAQVKAATRLKTPDALVVASAALSGCAAVISNDRGFEVLDKVSTIRLASAGGGMLKLPRYIQVDDFRN